mgnify:CR=1 FL=1
MKKITLTMTIVLISSLAFQMHVHASCYSSYRGTFQNSDVKLNIRTTHSSGPSPYGFYSSRSLVIKLVSKNSDVKSVKVIINNVLFYVKNHEEVRIGLYKSMKPYKISMLYWIPNKDKKAPRWKRRIHIIKNLEITRENKGACHYNGKLFIKEVK